MPFLSSGSVGAGFPAAHIVFAAMLRRHLIRGYSDRVFYAETSGNAEKIFELGLHGSKPETVVKREILPTFGLKKMI